VGCRASLSTVSGELRHHGRRRFRNQRVAAFAGGRLGRSVDAVDDGVSRALLKSVDGHVPSANRVSIAGIANAARDHMAAAGRPARCTRDAVGVSAGYLYKYAKESPAARDAVVGRMILQKIDVAPGPVSQIRASLDRDPVFRAHARKPGFDFIAIVHGLVAQGLATFVLSPRSSKTNWLAPRQPHTIRQTTDPVERALVLRDTTQRIVGSLRQMGREIDERVPDDQRTVLLREVTISFPASMAAREVARTFAEKGGEAYRLVEDEWKRSGVPLSTMKIDWMFSMPLAAPEVPARRAPTPRRTRSRS
jgi:hypothetical protein